MKKLFVLFFASSFVLSFSQAPKSKDSLVVYLKTKPKDTLYVEALNNFAFVMVQEGKMDEAKKCIVQMNQISSSLHFGSGFYFVENMKGIIEYSAQNPEKAMEYFIKSTKIIEKYKLPKKRYQNALNNIAIIYDQMGDRENATKYAVRLINYQEKNKLSPLKSSPYNQLGNNLKFYKKYNEALTYYNKSLAIESGLKSYTGMAISENLIGNLYDDLQQYQKAIVHFGNGLKYAEADNYKLLQTDLLTNLGRMYQKTNDHSKAEKYLKKSEALCRELETTHSLKSVCGNLGDLYYFQKKYSLSEKYYLEALALAKEIEDREYLYVANQNLSELYEATKDYKKALFYKQQAEVDKDSLNKSDIAENTENLLRKYEAGKKEQQIAIKNIQINNANKQKWYLIGGILLLCIIGVLLFYQSRNRKKTNKKLQVLNNELDEANKTKTRFFSILNHDLRSPVANLIHFLHLQKDNPELLDAGSKKRLENKTISGAENLLTSMEDILLWSKGQMQNFKPQPRNIQISSLFEDTQKHFESEEKVTITFENPNNLSLVTDENYLKTILRNLTGNAIRALNGIDNPTIIWKAWKENDATFLSISDNGAGGTQDQFKALYDDKEVVGIKTGLGLHLIRDLAKAINCEIAVNSAINKGTTFTLQIKHQQI